MRYEENPFNILHVSMRDSQEKILDKVEDLSLTLDEALCSQASSILTNPTKRLEAEVSWFPGYTPKKVKEAFEDAKSTPDEFIDNFSEDELSYADVNAEILAFLNIPYPNMLKDYLLKIAADLENVDTDALFTELNKERNVAGIPAIPNIEVLTTALQHRQQELAETIYSFLKSFGQDKLVDILTSAIEESTDFGELESETLLLQLIEKYEVDIQASLENAASKVAQQISFIQDSADKGISDGELNSAINTLDSLLKAWVRLAQPIQVSMQSQGLEHSASTDLAYSIRQLALKLYNEHSHLDASKRIIELMKSIFAEVLTVAEKSDEDMTVLNRINIRDVLVSKAFSNCDKHVNEVKSDPKSGYRVANVLLSELEEKLKNSANIAPHEAASLDEIADVYINAMLACLVKWGNTTKNWHKCYEFTKKVSKYAKKPDTIARINKHLNILYENMTEQSNSTSNNKLGCLGVIAVILVLFFVIGSNSGPSKSSSPSNRPQTTQRQSSSQKPIPRKNVITGYEEKHPYLNDEGLCEITIDNKKNDMPVYVRIWDVQQQTPVRAFYIRQGESFTANELTPGKYEVRYRELYENDTPSYGSKSEPFSLEQRRTPTGTEYSTLSLTLYKVRNGNTRTERINANDI